MLVGFLLVCKTWLSTRSVELATRSSVSNIFMFPGLVILDLIHGPLFQSTHQHRVSDTFMSDRTVYATNLLVSKGLVSRTCTDMLSRSMSRFQCIRGVRGTNLASGWTVCPSRFHACAWTQRVVNIQPSIGALALLRRDRHPRVVHPAMSRVSSHNHWLLLVGLTTPASR